MGMKFALVVCFAALVTCEPEAKPEAKADPWYGYYGHPYAYGGYRAYGYGYPYAHHGLYYGKRSAEAAADPYYGVYGYGLGYGLGYRTYGYGYPYAHHGYAYCGKRYAEAEPTAAAEPNADAYYGYYGYGARPYYGLGYRGYGLGYRGYYWG